MKLIDWLGDTKDTLAEFPKEVKLEIGLALFQEQKQEFHPSIKIMKGFKHAVREIRSRHRKDAYRAVYVVNLGDKIYVLHVFQKKSKTGISTPKSDMALIRERLKQVEADAKKGKK